jgi:hypothetical protein
MDRLVKIQNKNTDLKIGFCLDPNDLAVSKLAAGREKDWPFVELMIKHKMVDVSVIEERVGLLPIANEKKRVSVFHD